MISYWVVPNLALYGVATGMVLVEHWVGRPNVCKWAIRLFLPGLAIQTVYLAAIVFGTDSAHLGRNFVTALLAWTCAAVYAILLLKGRWQNLSGYFLPVVFLLFLQSIVRGPEYTLVQRVLPAGWAVPVHLTVAALSVAIFLVCGVIALTLLRASSSIKSRRPGRFWLTLPALPSLERTLTTFLSLGFITLTFTLITGLLITAWAHHMDLRPWRHQWGSLLAWGIYGIVLKGRWFDGQLGRKGALLSLIGGVVILLSFIEAHAT